jgi:hypothetical protein
VNDIEGALVILDKHTTILALFMFSLEREVQARTDHFNIELRVFMIKR